MEIFSVGYFLLGIQRALLKAITPDLRAVNVDVDRQNQLVYVRFYYNSKISEETINLWGSTIAEASAGLGPDCKVNDKIKRLDYPQKIPNFGYLAYLRKEKNLIRNDPRLNKSILKRENLKQFVSQYIGLGKKMNDREPRKPGYSEMVNFNEFIGYAINRETFEQMSTNWGITHYLEDGVYIIPAYQGSIEDLNVYPIAYAMLAMQNALLGVAIPELRAVFVDFTEEKVLYIRFYYDGEVSKEDIHLWEIAISEVYADLGQNYLTDAKIERLDYPNKIPSLRGRYAYLRNE